MSKLTLEEKKLEKIRLQLFGKEQSVAKKVTAAFPDVKVETVSKAASFQSADTVFLKQDLMKVFLISAFLIGGQFLLYFLSLNGVIKLDVFHIF